MNKNHDHASYADRAWHGQVTVDENARIARDTYRLRFRCGEIARAVLPGQFIMLRLPDSSDPSSDPSSEPLLGRPLAVYDVAPDADSKPEGIEIVYLVVGRMTRRLAAAEPGRTLQAWGPLGNGFPPTETDELLMVAGGIGQTPLLTLAQEYLGRRAFGDPPRRVPQAAKVTLCYGARSKDYLAGIDDFRRSGVEVHVATEDGATEDGSAGHHGLVTELVRPIVEQSPRACRIVCCGPEPMMAATAAIARELKVPCQVSLERRMACGLGICFGCVAKVRDSAGKWDYRRTCVEGPVFDAEEIEFE